MSKSEVKREVGEINMGVRREARQVRGISRILFVDLLRDKHARPVLGYAAGTITVGAVVYHYLEGWSWLDSFYFVVVSLTTIGYGDLAPTRSITKFLTIFYAINGVAILLLLLDEIRRLRSPVDFAVETEGESD